MKKRMVFVSLVFLILFMSVFVSASFADFWNKVTGKVTINQTNNHTAECITVADCGEGAARCVNGTCTGLDEHGCVPDGGYTWCEEKQKCLRTWEESCQTNITCTDSDGGENYYVEGTTKGINDAMLGGYTNATDKCEGNTLYEYVCLRTASTNNYPIVVGLNEYNCSNGCEDGACIKEEGSCIDSDGENYYIKGEVTGHWLCPEDGRSIETEKDYCVNETTVFEFFCNNPGGCDNILAYEAYCPLGCQDGACVQEKACINPRDCPAKYVCQNSICILEKALRIDSPKNGAIINKPTPITFTIKNTEDRTLEFKDPFTNGNDGLQLIIEDMGRQWNLWSTGDIRDGEIIELKLDPNKSVIKTIEFDPNYNSPHPDPFKFAGDVKLILRHFVRTDTYGLGSLGSDEINISISLTGNVLIEKDVGEFKYKSSEINERVINISGQYIYGGRVKQYSALYMYKNNHMPVTADIWRLESISQADDFFNEMLERFIVPFSLMEINGNEIYSYNNHTFWKNGIDVIFVGDITGEGDISIDLAKAYLERFSSEIGKEEIEPVCGNGICEEGESVILCVEPNLDAEGNMVGEGGCKPICPVDCSSNVPENNTYICQGCILDNKCYPFGYRKSGKYCAESEEFVVQKESGSCDNSFECSSNLCVSDECVGRNLIQRILDWFKNLFGIQ